MNFDVIVVGRGLIGCAAARHLALLGAHVAVIGPDENTGGQDPSAPGTGIFASHYDEGRITRILDPDPVWASLAERSIARYQEIEIESRVPFFEQVGCAFVLDGEDPGFDPLNAVARRLGLVIERLEDIEIEQRMPYLTIEEGAVAYLETSRAGHISPRRLVEAQAAAATRRGADVIADTVVAVEVGADGVTVTGAGGRAYGADRVLIATGGHTPHSGFVPRALDLSTKGRLVVFAHLDDDTADDLADMPSLITARETRQGRKGVYILPPILYPDGSTRIKIGSERYGADLGDAEAIRRWFTDPADPTLTRQLSAELLDLLPDLKGMRLTAETCMVTETASGYPYLDWAGDRIAVAVGGNGAAAKSSDEIGRLAASLFAEGDAFDGYPDGVFAARFAA